MRAIFHPARAILVLALGTILVCGCGGCGGGGPGVEPAWPVALAKAEPNPQIAATPVTFQDDGSYDPDGGAIVRYEWDWDNDGVYDEEGIVVEHTWNQEGTYQVQFRVTDDETTTGELNEPLEITIYVEIVDPIALAQSTSMYPTVGEPVHFLDNGSYDPDGGDIALYEWDWDNDGVYDEEGNDVYHTWDTLGTRYVQFRVTDDEGATDDLDQPLVIYVVTDVAFDPVDVTPRWLQFMPGQISVQGNYAYALGHGLHVFDISDPLSPSWVHWIDIPGEVEIVDGYAYADNHGGLDIIDIDPLESAHVVKTIPLPDSVDGVRGISVDDGYAYLAIPGYLGGVRGMLIVDIDPIDSAHVVNMLETSKPGKNVAAKDGYAYFATRYEDVLYIIDVDPPEEAHVTDEIHTGVGEELNRVVVGEDLAYMVDGDGLKIIDISTPGTGHIIKSVDTPGGAMHLVLDVAVEGGYAYVADCFYGLQIIDVDPPESAYILNSVDTTGATSGVASHGGYVYLGDGSGGLRVVDVDPPESAYIAKTVGTTANAGWRVAVENGVAYLTDEWAGLHIVDVDPPEEAVCLNTFNDVNGIWSYGVTAEGGYAYVVGPNFTGGLRIIDVEPPGSAHIVSLVEYPGRGVALSNGYACVAGGGFAIVDVDPPESPYILTSIGIAGSATFSVALDGGYAYVGSNSSELQIVDIDPIESAYVVTSASTGWLPYGVAVEGGYAYVAIYDDDYVPGKDEGALAIMDISPPELAHIVKTVPTPGIPRGVEVVNGFAYVADDSEGLEIIDIDPIDSAGIIATVDTPGSAWDVAVSGEYAYVADYSGGLRIIKLW